MIAVNLDRVTVTYLHDPIFSELSWEIHDNQCVGLIGPNGSGKSSLLRLIAGELESDSGFVVRRKGLKIGYLQQDPRLEAGRSVLQEALTALPEIFHIEEQLNSIETSLSDPQVYTDEKTLARTLDRQAHLLDDYTRLGGPGYEGQVRSTLLSLGFAEHELTLPVEALSGGQKKLVGLAKLMILKPDLLLLDEPDNHLDLEGKAFLERYIRAYQGAVVIVSHDRYLLDLVVDAVAELEDGRLSHYNGNYSEYAFEKQAGLLRQQQAYQAQQKEITRLEQSAKRLLTWGKVYDNEKFHKRGVNILKRLERIERIERPVLERRRMNLELSGWRGSNKVLEIIDLEKAFPLPDDSDKVILFAGLNLLIWHGERVGLVGPNGAGKSMLFRHILSQEPVSGGEIKIGPSILTGYYAQEHQTLDPQATLIDTVRYAGEMSESSAVAYLGRFLFTYEQARGRIMSLSGGERSRLQMALLMLSGANFLLLDEPTNNLDILSAEVLEDALEDFEGTVLVISHDRYFLDRVAGRIIELDGGRLNDYAGNYSDYMAAKSG